jgi:hypothetical protein
MKLTLMTCLAAWVLCGADAFSDENRTAIEGDLLNAEVQLLRSEYQQLKQRLSSGEQSTAEDIAKLVDSISTLERRVEGLVAQSVELASESETYRAEITQAQNRLANELRATIDELQGTLDSIRDDGAQERSQIKMSLDSTSSTAEMARADLTSKIESQIVRIGDLEGDTDTLRQSVKQHWIAFVILVAAVLTAIIALYLKQTRLRQETLQSIDGVKGTMKDDYVALDEKLLELIDARQLTSTAPNQEDHSLALKVADEIVRIRKNISRMDESTKGLKQLAASVTRIQDNFAANGYEIVEMLGKPYSEGMKAAANFITDDSLDEGQQIITRIIKPQVNYEGVMIQSAQIEVSVRE